MCDDEPFKMLEFRSTKPAATSQPYRVEPELRSLSVPLDVDVRWLVAICRVEEKPVRALTMDRRHKISVSLCWSEKSRLRYQTYVKMLLHQALAADERQLP